MNYNNIAEALLDEARKISEFKEETNYVENMENAEHFLKIAIRNGDINDTIEGKRLLAKQLKYILVNYLVSITYLLSNLPNNELNEDIFISKVEYVYDVIVNGAQGESKRLEDIRWYMGEYGLILEDIVNA